MLASYPFVHLGTLCLILPIGRMVTKIIFILFASYKKKTLICQGLVNCLNIRYLITKGNLGLLPYLLNKIHSIPFQHAMFKGAEMSLVLELW